eukprot:CAMPEP_0176499984 /NCGR_PEP_ID=MMETSP0200_2-20121128/13255_1 /TAXON_ID=947934 /ORGANISM="Chaetoceros sp., Strain GSL56" /LENGTH=451 /DNA_ID=CAMNT_0017898513 /DNA_START=1 /DNA_END=1352 /DNA_ORIENTATION=-
MIYMVLCMVSLLKIHNGSGITSYFSPKQEHFVATNFDNHVSFSLAEEDAMDASSAYYSRPRGEVRPRDTSFESFFDNDNRNNDDDDEEENEEKEKEFEGYYLNQDDGNHESSTTTMRHDEDDNHDDGNANSTSNTNSTNTTSATTNHDRELNIAYITFSHLSNSCDFESTVLEAVNTWVPSDSTYFVVLNHKWTQKFDQWKKQKLGAKKWSDTVIHRIQPIYVDCPEAKAGESPCCKQQKGLVEFHKTYNVLVGEKSYDWIVYMDDDVYLQPNVLQGYIKTLPFVMPELKNYTMENGDPMLITASIPYRLGRSGYMRSLSSYRCSRDEDFKYPWGQPVIYNQAAFQMVIPGLQLNGLVQQCLEYNVTHDVGNALFHWMYSIPSARVRAVNFKGKKPQWGFREDTIAYHGAGSNPNITMQLFHERRTKHMKVPFSAPKEYYGWFMTNGFQRT